MLYSEYEDTEMLKKTLGSRDILFTDCFRKFICKTYAF